MVQLDPARVGFAVVVALIMAVGLWYRIKVQTRIAQLVDAQPELVHQLYQQQQCDQRRQSSQLLRHDAAGGTGQFLGNRTGR